MDVEVFFFKSKIIDSYILRMDKCIESIIRVFWDQIVPILASKVYLKNIWKVKIKEEPYLLFECIRFSKYQFSFMIALSDFNPIWRISDRANATKNGYNFCRNEN